MNFKAKGCEAAKGGIHGDSRVSNQVHHSVLGWGITRKHDFCDLYPRYRGLPLSTFSLPLD